MKIDGVDYTGSNPVVVEILNKIIYVDQDIGICNDNILEMTKKIADLQHQIDSNIRLIDDYNKVLNLLRKVGLVVSDGEVIDGDDTTLWFPSMIVR